MHHFDHKDGHVNYNSDLSGEVQIVNSRGEELWVSGDLLRDFITEAACPDPTTLEGDAHSSTGHSPTL